MKQMNGCVQEVMEPKPEAEAPPEEGRTPTPQLLTNSSTPLPPAAAQTPDPTLEFSLVIKPKGTPVFRLSALYKSRLQFCLGLHYFMFLVMLAKLSEDILDRMDIFILELEELYVPKPLLWEWLWTSSIIFAIIGSKAIQKNNLKSMNSFAIGILLFGMGPLIGAAVYYFNDIMEYADKKSEAEIEKWKGYPIALLVYIFAVVVMQVHIFSLYFAVKLIKLWRAKAKKH